MGSAFTDTHLTDTLLERYMIPAVIVGGAVAVPAALAIVGFAPAGVAAGKYLSCSFLSLNS